MNAMTDSHLLAARCLRIYISESDHWRGKSLESALVETLLAHGMAGATVLHGAAGFGAHAQIHTTRSEALSLNLPVVIEVVDTPEKIDNLLPTLAPMLRESLATLEDVQSISFAHLQLHPLPAGRTVAQAMTRAVVSLRVDEPLREAWQRMLTHAIKALPVVDAAGQVAGILTDEDLLERAGLRQRLSIARRLDAAEINQDLETLRASALQAADVMTHPAVTAQEDEPLTAAVARMAQRGLKRLPVVNAQGILCGMLSRLDVLRQVAQSPAAAPFVPAPFGAVKTVGELMRADLPSASQDDSLANLVEKFNHSASHRLVVVDPGGRAIGLISDSDIVSRIQPERRGGILAALRRLGKPPAGQETAQDLMSPGPLTCPPSLGLVDAVRRMLAASRKWLVVVDADGKALGLVDRATLFEAISQMEASSQGEP